jgi:hypothetical protein
LPNLGAEEGAAWVRRSALPRVAATLRLWRHLFGAPQQWLGTPAPEEDWPETLGPRPDEAAFDWLSGVSGACWLGDRAARSALAEAGDAGASPSPAVVAKVHDKDFAVQAAEAEGYLPACLEGLSATYSPEDLADPDSWLDDVARRLAHWPAWVDGAFTLKPRLGSSGRGRVGGRAPALETAKIRAALPRLARQGGAVLEPWLQRETDLSVMLHIAPAAGTADGAITLLGASEQLLAPSGVYLGHLGEIDSRGRVFSGGPWEEPMREAAAAAASRARAQGYWGPCGVDGFAFRGPETGDAGAPLQLRPLVEFNARFTVGIVAAGLIRRALGQVRPRLALEPGERRGFLFALDPPPGWSHWGALSEATGPGSLLLPLAPESPEKGQQARPALLFARDAATLRAAVSAGATPAR